MQSTTTTANNHMEVNVPQLFDELCNPDIPQTQKKTQETQLTQLVESKKLSLNDSIKDLGSYLVNTNDRIRTRAYSTLNTIISHLDEQSVMSTHPQTVASLCRFCGDRLGDFECLSDILVLVSTLLHTWRNSVPEDQALFILSQLNNEVNVPTLNHKGRMAALEIYNYFLLFNPSYCKVDYVNGFIRAIDGERDPVTLVKIFSMVPRMATIAPQAVASNSEELFEVTSVYFPISFNPPADDPRKITAADLALGLNATLACHPSMANYVVPFLLEKISSALIETKIAAFDCLSNCVEQYGESSVRMFLTEIWTYVRTEILRTTNLDVLHSALECIRIICTVVCDTPNKNQNSTNMEGIIRPAISELKSPECKFAPLYGRMIYSVAIASPDICNLVCFRLLQELSLVLYEANTRDKKAGTLTIGTQVLEALYRSDKEKHVEAKKHVSALWDAVSSLISDVSIQREMCEILCRFALFSDQADANVIFKYINEALCSEDRAVSKNALAGVKWIYQFESSIVKDQVLTPLLSKTDDRLNRVIAVITQLGSDCHGLCPHITDALYKFFLNSFGTADKNTNQVLLAAMNVVVDKSQIESTKSCEYIRGIIGIILQSTGSQSSDKDTSLLLGKLLHVLYRGISESDQQALLNDIVLLVSESRVDLFNSSISNFKPLDASNVHVQFIPIFASIFVATRPAVAIPNVEALASQLTNLCLSDTANNDAIQGAAQCLASIVNKISDTTTLQSIISQQVEERIMATATNNQLDSVVRLHSIEALGWTLKGLIARGVKLSSNLANTLFTLLNDSDVTISRKTADAFEIIMADYELVLHKNTHAKIGVLYKQKFFSMNISGLLESMRKAKGERSQNEGSILFAIAHLIHNVPKTVILGEVERLFPLVISVLSTETIDISNRELIVAALKTTETLLTEAKEQMASYIGSIIPVLLRLTRERSSVRVRMAAVDCLSHMTDYPFHQIFVHKQIIINGLEKALDDPKRHVRRAAVRVRNEWFVLAKE